MNTDRPEASTVAIWDTLDKLATDYHKLADRCRVWGATVVDRKFIERTAQQLEATRNQISDGTIEQATAVAIIQAGERMLPLARDLVRARAGQRHIDPDSAIPYSLTTLGHHPPAVALVTRDDSVADEVPC